MTPQSAPPPQFVPATPDSISPRHRINWLQLVALAALAVGTRAYLCAQETCISRDGVVFVEFARQLADEPLKYMKAVTKQPGYSYLLLGAQRLPAAASPEQWQLTGQLIALTGGVASCLCVFFLTRRLFDDRAAVVAAIFAAFWPEGALLSADVLSDMPHLAVYLPALLVGLRVLERQSPAGLILCGILAGIAYLVRQEALGLVAAVAICLLWFGPAPSRKRNFAAAALFLISFAVVIAPYSLATGRLLGNKGPEDVLESIFSLRATVAPSPHDLARIVSPWQTPGHMVELWARSGRYVFALLCLAALFVKTVPRAERKGARLIAVAVLMQLLLVQMRVIWFGEISSRYLVIPAALSIPWAACGFVHLVTHVAARIYDPKPSRRAAVWFSAFIIALTPLIFYITRGEKRKDDHLREAGLWLAGHMSEGDTVLSNERLGQVRFYAAMTYPEDMRWRTYNDAAAPDQVIDTIRRRDPRWFIYLRGKGGHAAGPDVFADALKRDALAFGQGDLAVHVFRRGGEQ